jgi:hypothetical protein
MLVTLGLLSLAHAGTPSPLQAGVYDWQGEPIVVGKKGKTIQLPGGESQKVVVLGPHLVGTPDGIFHAVAYTGDTLWRARYVLSGDVLSSEDGLLYTWGPDGCVPQDPEAYTVPTCETDEAGVRRADGSVLHPRGPGLWTSETMPMLRGATFEEAREKQLNVFVDGGIVSAVASASGNWGDEMSNPVSVAAGKLTDGYGSTYELRPIAPCMVASDADGGVLGFWSDGKRLAFGDVAVKRGDVVWACEAGGNILVRYEGADCQAYSWSVPQGWMTFDALCAGSAAEPATIRTGFSPSDVVGVWASEMVERR